MKIQRNQKNKGKERQQHEPVSVDATNLSIDQIVASVTSQINLTRNEGMKYDPYYAGICKDPSQNLTRHNSEKYEILVDCGSRENAGEVEKRLGELGFDVGDRADCGGDEETIFLYVIRKHKDFQY